MERCTVFSKTIADKQGVSIRHFMSPKTEWLLNDSEVIWCICASIYAETVFILFNKKQGLSRITGNYCINCSFMRRKRCNVSHCKSLHRVSDLLVLKDQCVYAAFVSFRPAFKVSLSWPSEGSYLWFWPAISDLVFWCLRSSPAATEWPWPGVPRQISEATCGDPGVCSGQ